jgi:integrase
MLSKWKKCQEEGLAWENQKMANNILREFKRHLESADIKPKGSLSIHTLRKCCGKNWADNLPPNVTKELMGHSNIATTMKYYTQVDKDQRAKAAAIMDELISRENPKKSDARETPEADFEQNSVERKV